MAVVHRVGTGSPITFLSRHALPRPESQRLVLGKALVPGKVKYKAKVILSVCHVFMARDDHHCGDLEGKGTIPTYML